MDGHRVGAAPRGQAGVQFISRHCPRTDNHLLASSLHRHRQRWRALRCRPARPWRQERTSGSSSSSSLIAFHAWRAWRVRRVQEILIIFVAKKDKLIWALYGLLPLESSLGIAPASRICDRRQCIERRSTPPRRMQPMRGGGRSMASPPYQRLGHGAPAGGVA